MALSNTMQYRSDRHGTQISALGYGCMRFSRSGSSIDLSKAKREVVEAIALGINYFDTAYFYPGNEVALGEILSGGGLRDKVLVATKLPLIFVRGRDSIDRLFETQLRRLKTDHIDYYLMHMLNDIPTWKRLQALGIEDWLEKKRACGEIVRVGFSYHGSAESFRYIIDSYDWDMCQIQYNYMDENFQAGKSGLDYASSRGVPTVIMEPLRGGRLVGLLPQSAKDIIAKENVGTAARLALRWLWNQPEVMCVLSGMNSLEMVRENAATAAESPVGCLTGRELEVIERVRSEIVARTKVNCTGCGYCMPCPKGVDIPTAFRCLNLVYSENKPSARVDYRRCTVYRNEQSSASQCVGCGACEAHCPQNIEIRKMLKEAARELEGITYPIVKRGVKILKIY